MPVQLRRGVAPRQHTGALLVPNKRPGAKTELAKQNSVGRCMCESTGRSTPLHDARHFVLEVLTEEQRQKTTWRQVVGDLRVTAEGGDVLDATFSLEIALNHIVGAANQRE